MLITKEVEVIPTTNRMLEHYRNKGYDVQIRKPLKVKVEDLTPSSAVFVDTTCDYCGKQKQPMRYRDYTKTTKNGTLKCCCTDCAPIKQAEIMMEKYGHKSPLQVPEFREKFFQTNNERYGGNSSSCSKYVIDKMKNTMLERYGVENAGQSKEIREKVKKTNLEKYGVEYVFQNEVSKEKVKQTNLERYGTECYLQSEVGKEQIKQILLKKYNVTVPLKNKEIYEKMKQTNLERYGVEYISQIPEIKQKVKETNLERYGAENASQNPEIKQKIIETNLERYGVDYIMKLPSFHEHAREVDMEKYGVYHHLQNPEILAKQKETFYKHGTCNTSSQQTYLHNLYGGELNYPVSYYSADICFPEEHLVIEYDGGGHNLTVKLNGMSQEEFKRKEIIRNSVLKHAGYRTMRIISSTDKLPSDEILLSLLSHAKQYFSTYPYHSWIEFNIDTSSIRSAEEKEGVFFDYGELRRIKKSA